MGAGGLVGGWGLGWGDWLLFFAPFEGAGLGPPGLGPLSLLGLASLCSPSLPFPYPLGLFAGPFVYWGTGGLPLYL